MSDQTPMSAEEVETTCYCDIPCGEIIAYGVCKSSPTSLPAMSEQPPVGDNVVLGKGGTFEVHGHFDGWAAYPGGPWEAGNWNGVHSDVIYAAPRDSEVARLNGLDKPPAVHGESADKDAMIRGLVAEMKRYLPVIEWVECSDHWQQATKGYGIATANGYRHALRQAEQGGGHG